MIEEGEKKTDEILKICFPEDWDKSDFKSRVEYFSQKVFNNYETALSGSHIVSMFNSVNKNFFTKSTNADN